jgi:hypothetical protein
MDLTGCHLLMSEIEFRKRIIAAVIEAVNCPNDEHLINGFCREMYALEVLATETVRTPNNNPDKAFQVTLLSAAARSGDPGAISLAAQLSGAAPCEKCGYIKHACRCASLRTPTYSFTKLRDLIRYGNGTVFAGVISGCALEKPPGNGANFTVSDPKTEGRPLIFAPPVCVGDRCYLAYKGKRIATDNVDRNFSMWIVLENEEYSFYTQEEFNKKYFFDTLLPAVRKRLG